MMGVLNQEHRFNERAAILAVLLVKCIGVFI